MPEDKTLAQNSQKVLEYLDQYSGSCLVMLDDQLLIKYCNQAFLNIIGLHSVPIGESLNDFLLQEGEILPDDLRESGYHRVDLTLVNTMQIQIIIIGYFVPIEEGFLLFCEKTWLAEDEIFQEISKINNQLANMTRALNKKNTVLEKTQEALKLQARERAAVDTFTYSVSHDLQAPLRRIEGFSEALLEECPDELSDQARDYLNRIVTQVGSMKNLTDALLQLSRVVSREIDRETVDLSALARAKLENLQYEEPERRLKLVVAPGLIAEGDLELLNLMLSKLLDNAWKFTSGVEEARIEFGRTRQDGRTIYHLKDNGVGFDMNHAEKLFTPFQKLHSEEDYPGIGIGLNLVYRIISRHGGEIWAEGEVDKGATFYFTLGRG